MFEEYLKELENIVNKLENSEVGIEESIALFKNGTEISKKCLAIIQNGKESIKEIKNDMNNISETPATFE